jgi:hypothetical protein
MSPADVHARLVTIFPDFAGYWDSPSNYFREGDGTFSLWGVFAEFSSYFREHFASFSPSVLTALARFIEECMASPGTDIDNAAATCFLENLAGHDSAAALRPFLGQVAQDFLGQYV